MSRRLLHPVQTDDSVGGVPASERPRSRSRRSGLLPMAPPSPASRARDMVKIVLIAICAALSVGAFWAVLELLRVI